MSLPLYTQTLTFTRVEADPDADGYAPNPPAPTQVGIVRGVVSVSSGSTRLVGGERVINNTTIRSDPIAAQPGDVVDDGQGNQWTVLNVTQVNMLLKFTICSCRVITGAT